MKKPVKQPRVIITARLLVRTFGNLDTDTFLGIISPFAEEHYADAIREFDALIALVESAPEEPHKKDVVDSMKLLKGAYERMSPVERSRVHRDLGPIIEEIKTRTSVN